MADRLGKVAAFIFGPSAKADEDDDFEAEYSEAEVAEEPTDIVDLEAAKSVRRERPRPVVQPSPVTSLDQRRHALPTPRPIAMSEITHVRPTSFAEAASIGETFKDGVPIILNLTTTDERQAQKLIDFASGMAFVTNGKLEKITSRVFLLIPATVQFTDTDRNQLAEAQRLHE
jgi:cell division inhibitor SepF